MNAKFGQGDSHGNGEMVIGNKTCRLWEHSILLDVKTPTLITSSKI